MNNLHISIKIIVKNIYQIENIRKYILSENNVDFNKQY